MQFTAPMAMINLDGNLDDWQCAPIKAQTPFYPFNKEGGIGPAGATFAEGTHCCGDELTMFDDRDGLTWNALDQSSAISFAWDAGNFYIGVKVVDESLGCDSPAAFGASISCVGVSRTRVPSPPTKYHRR